MTKVEERSDRKKTLSEKCAEFEFSGPLVLWYDGCSDLCRAGPGEAREVRHLNRALCSSVKCSRPIALEENNSDPLVSSELGTLAASCCNSSSSNCV